jgi:hypothetical protein
MMFSHLGPSDADNVPPDLLAWRTRTTAPENEIPTAVAFSAVLTRNDDIAVALVGLRAFSVGLQFDVMVRFRTVPPGRQSADIYSLIGGHTIDEESAQRRLLLGLEYSDGRRVTNVGFRFPPPATDPDAPTLMATGGSGGELTYDQSYWLHPLPPPGPLLVVCRWPAFDLPESRITLDGDAIVQAAGRAITLWPWTEPADQRSAEPPPPPLPEDGWFAARP